MKIRNLTKKTVIAQKAKLADTFVSRMVGLLNRSSIDDDEALVITQCRSIHMIFMKFAIDAIFVDKDEKVVGLCNNIKPYQLSRIFWKASCVIELKSGTISKSQTEVGDTLEME